MYVNDNSSLLAFFGEVCYSGGPFAVRTKETRGRDTKLVGKDGGQTLPYSGHLSKQSSILSQ